MPTLNDVKAAITDAMKAKDRTRVDALRLLSNEVQKVAKEDGNREATEDDIITGANRLVKRANETLSFLPEGDERRPALEAEIKIVSEFLPQKMSRDELSGLISTLVGQAPQQGKAAKGYVMKNLNGQYRGQFDNREANEILTELVG